MADTYRGGGGRWPDGKRGTSMGGRRYSAHQDKKQREETRRKAEAGSRLLLERLRAEHGPDIPRRCR
jgi:hypothetical protein